MMVIRHKRLKKKKKWANQIESETGSIIYNLIFKII